MLGIALLATGCDRPNKMAKENKKDEVTFLNINKQEEYKEQKAPANATDSAGIGNSYFSDLAGDDKIRQNKAPVVAAPQPQPDWDKKIIKNGTLGLEIRDYSKFTMSLREKVRALGGYVASEQQSQSDFKIENIMTIKVPVDQFDNAMQSFSSDVIKVNDKKISSDDVTRQYVDARTRMESKKAILQRYMELLKQARNMEEILNVQSEINTIQEELETAGGEAEFLKHESTFSTINLTYFEVIDPAAAAKEKTGNEHKLIAAFRTGWNGITMVAIELISIWPVLLGALAAVMVIRKRRIKQPVAVS